MTESQKQLVKAIKWALDRAEVWPTGDKYKDDVYTMDFEYLGKNEELLENKPEIRITIKWDV